MQALRPLEKPLSLAREPTRKPPFVCAFEAELDHVYRTFRRFGFSEVDAEDLSQEVFLVMWRRWDEYDAGRPLRAWLAGIAFRVAQHHRRKRREVLGVLVETEDQGAGPHEHLAASRARALVLSALERLPERHRSALVMSDLDGLTMPAVAEALAVPLATAYTRVRRARLAFADEVARLQKAGPEPRAESRAGLLGFEALLAYERPTPPLPAVVRRRALARVEAALRHPAPLPGNGLPGPRLTPTSLSLGAAGIVTLIAAGTLMLRPSTPTTATALAAAAAVRAPGSAFATTREGRPRRRMPPRLASTGAASASAPEHRLARGLTGYWRFDEGQAATNDLSSSGRDCRVRGLDPARALSPEGVHGDALALRGRGWLDCSVAESDDAGPRELSAAAWIRPDRPSTHHRSIFSLEVNGSNYDAFFLGFEGGSLKAQSKSWSGGAKIPYPAAPGRWTHVAVTQLSDGVVVLYIDGVEAARNQVQLRRSPRGTRRLLIGAGYDSSGRHLGQKFHGLIDELVMYDRALGPEDVAALAAGTQPALSD